jgi:excisionase family DNA binding protein
MVAMNSELVTVKEAADFMRISEQFVYKLVDCKELSAYKIGRRVLIAATEIEKYLLKVKTA